ncbi:hypothetical protein EYF80_057034 [Liparis tanakae]|uniref:Uncharacterized protein n=1 Tax=Liparis tanakae TaxID=230148 RepID=A0A4Z2EVB2_9TELE|nr:hypothetical protein EYF80_057034 [Liparis tanakae]
MDVIRHHEHARDGARADSEPRSSPAFTSAAACRKLVPSSGVLYGGGVATRPAFKDTHRNSGAVNPLTRLVAPGCFGAESRRSPELQRRRERRPPHSGLHRRSTAAPRPLHGRSTAAPRPLQAPQHN